MRPPIVSRPALEVEEARQRRAVDVGVEDADAEPVGLEREREVDRGGRLADAALAARHRDDRVDAGDARPCRGRRGRLAPAAVRCRRGPRRLLGGAGGGPAGRGGAGERAAAPPFFSAVSTTMAPSTPGMPAPPLGRGRAAAPCRRARSAGTVIENITLPPEMKMSETRPRATMSPSPSGPRTPAGARGPVPC